MRQLLTVPSLFLLLLVYGTTIEVSVAQTEGQDAEALNALYGDFAAPDLTAPTLLGVNSNQVSKPANVKAFAANLIGAVANFPEKGKGLGIEIAPAQFFQRSAWREDAANKRTLNESLKSYAHWGNQLGRNFTISGAQISTDSTAKVALGGAVVLLDRTDPLLDADYIQEVSKAFSSQPALRFIDLYNTHNSEVATRRNQVYADQQIYNNAWPQAQRKAARPLLLAVEGLLNTAGLLPDSPNSLAEPQAFGASQDTAIKALETSLKAEARLTEDQRTALLDEAKQNSKAVKARYQQYYETRQQLTASTSAIIKAARENFDKKLWNATIIQAGGGWTWQSPDNKFSTLKNQSAGGFLRAALRPARADWDKAAGVANFMYWHTQLVLNVQYHEYHSSALQLPAENKTAADSLDNRLWYGARLLVGGAYFRLSIEGSIQKLSYNQLATSAAEKAKKSLSGTIQSATIGAEVRLVDKVWLEFAIGGAKPKGRDSQLLALTSLKYALRNSQRFKTN
ncbi:hypothetical protein [Hymenobacter lucidus]|uniref:Uncharacterized protein n=1 Tax=Hymenobacter lucidus TaxID=2880930 RepID=A0ABS8AV33_9BACT|nr:hypothetical protein [Hymenobacter lucidus]MCB2409231.1 hypothetical protein [Hymenobacter lucidus]